MPFGQPLQHCSPVNALLTYEHLPVRVKLEVAARDLGGGSTNFQTRLKFMNWCSFPICKIVLNAVRGTDKIGMTKWKWVTSWDCFSVIPGCRRLRRPPSALGSVWPGPPRSCATARRSGWVGAPWTLSARTSRDPTPGAASPSAVPSQDSHPARGPADDMNNSVLRYLD